METELMGPPEGVAEMLALERIARVLAAWPVAANAGGSDPSASGTVGRNWPDHLETAMAILKAIREPDMGMAAVGDAECWERMVEAAILGRARIDLPGDPFRPLPEVREAGTDVQSRDGPWSQRDEVADESFPASDPPPTRPGAD